MLPLLRSLLLDEHTSRTARAKSRRTFHAKLGVERLEDRRVLSGQDIVGFTSDAEFWVSESNGSTLTNKLYGAWSPAETYSHVAAADVNGDGLDDMVGRAEGDGSLVVALNNGDSSFTSATWGSFSTITTWTDVFVGDFNGDGMDDVLGRADSDGSLWVARSTGNSFVNSYWGKFSTSTTWTDLFVGDFNGDGMDDVLGRADSDGTFWVARSTGNSFVNKYWGSWVTFFTWNDVNVGDFNGDGRSDVIGRAGDGTWWVATSLGDRFGNLYYGKWSQTVTWNDVNVGDFNGDGLDDIAGRANNAYWWINRSSGSNFFFVEYWGSWTGTVTWEDVLVGDFDQDGNDDIGGRANGQWWLAMSNGSSLVNQYGGSWPTSTSWLDVAGGTFHTADTQPPTAPSSLSAVAISTSQIDLSWTAATDNVGVSQYLVERQDPGNANFVQVGTATGTTFSDTGLNAGGNYTYRVRATDAAGNLGPFSSEVSATTLTAVGQPELPREFVDTTLDPAYNRAADIIVNAGDNLQAALNTAQPGQIVEIEAGATFFGNFQLPNKQGNEWIYIRSSRYQELPAAGNRIGPQHAYLMPKLISPAPSYNEPTLKTHDKAHHYRLIGIEFTASENAQSIVRLGSGLTTTLTNLPEYVILDRVYIHASPTLVFRRGVELNTRHAAIVDSYISEIHDTGNDAQAILGYNGPGPFKIVNNYLEASGETIMFGGGDPRIQNLVPSDIEIRGNHFFRPLSWKAGHPTYAGTPWDVKNHFELKNAQRVWFQGNVLENNWPDAQSGFAIVLSARNADGGSPWSTVEDVLIEDNIIRNSAGGVSLLAQTGIAGHPAKNLKRVTIRNNLFENIDPLAYEYSYRQFQMSGTSGLLPMENVTIEHNTSYHVTRPQTFMTFGTSGPMATNLIVRNNLVSHGNYGVAGDGTVAGTPTLEGYAPGYVFTNNGLVKWTSGSGTGSYPQGNWLIPDVNAVGYEDYANGNYRLSSSSPYKGAGTDGEDLGADIDALPWTGVV